MLTKFTPSLEALDQREVPAVLAGDLPCGNEIEVRFPNRGGCWPGPQPVVSDHAIIVIGSAPQVEASPTSIIPIGGVGEFVEGSQKVAPAR